MIIVEVVRKTLDAERTALVSMEQDSIGTPVHAYLLGALSVIDWINAGERSPSSQMLWMLDQSTTGPQ